MHVPHATLDFETRSEAGYVWNHTLGRWEGPPGAPQGKKGLGVIGVAAYAQHPTTDILTLSWKLPDGRRGRWKPGDPLHNLGPLFHWIENGGRVEAHNFAFEFWIWWCVAMPRYGFPPLPLAQASCSMATARVNQFPGGLGPLGTVLRLPIQKDKEGARLLNKFSVPQKPTKKQPLYWITPADDPNDAERLYGYCDTDVDAEEWASRSMPPMTPAEREFWLVDQEINLRGIAIDREGVRACIAVLNEALAKYGAEFEGLTGGIKVTELAQFKGWLSAQGIYVDSLDADHLEMLLKRPELTPLVRRTLEIRELIGSASVKKLFSMENMASAQNRLHNLIVHHGARTGRPTGEGPQPLNLPKAGPKLITCSGCAAPFHPKHMACPWCGTVRPPPDVERDKRLSPAWRPEMADAVLAVMRAGLAAVEHYFGDAVLCIMGCVRALFEAAPEHDLIESDYSAIEAVVTAMLAQEEWRIADFRAGVDIYIAGASKITGKSVEWYEEYQRVHGHKHEDRQYIGKVSELACLAPETEVLTHLGYMALADVTPKHLVWDGIEWVKHQGPVSRGRRVTINLDGVAMTPDHKIICGSSWMAASELGSRPDILRQSLVSGSENLPSCAKPKYLEKTTAADTSCVTAAKDLTPSLSRTYATEKARDAANAPKEKRGRPGQNRFGGMRIFAPISAIVAGYSTVFRLSSHALTRNILPTPDIRTMLAAESSPSHRGETETTEGVCSSRTLSLFQGGMTRAWSLTASVLTRGMSPEICASSPERSIWRTNDLFPKCKPGSQNLRDVYDIAHAGPRNRFTIRTNSGHLIVHNCGFGGWIGAWRNFDDSDKFTDEEVKNIILAWRDASPRIVELWGGQSRGGWGDKRPELYGFEGAAISAIQNPGLAYTVAGITFYLRPAGTRFIDDDGFAGVTSCDTLVVRLLSGRELQYHEPMLSPSTRDYDPPWHLEISYMTWNTNPKYGPIGWVRMKTYGARLTENIVQAIAHDILRHAILALRAAGFPVVLHVYDSIMAEIPSAWPAEVLEIFEAIMSQMATWCHDWPVRAAGGWRGRRYRKE